MMLADPRIPKGMIMMILEGQEGNWPPWPILCEGLTFPIPTAVYAVMGLSLILF